MRPNLHNDPILSIEFVKTTPFAPVPALTGEKEADWVAGDLKNKNEQPLKLFCDSANKLHKNKNIPEFFTGSENNRSSLQKLRSNFEKVKKQVKFDRWAAIFTIVGIAIGVTGMFIGVMAYLSQTLDSNAQARLDARDAKSIAEKHDLLLDRRALTVDQQIEGLSQAIGKLESSFMEIEKQVISGENASLGNQNILDRLDKLEKRLDALTKNERTNRMEP